MPRRPSRHGRARHLLALLLVLLLLAPVTQAAFVKSGTILGGGTAFDGWSQPEVHAIEDGQAQGRQVGSNFERFWMVLGTQLGGTASAAPDNLIEYVYIRIDHSGNAPDPNSNFNIQLNLGSAASGKVDHLLSMRATTGTPPVLVRLSEYNVPYPDLGAFTTNTLTLRATNEPGDPLEKAGVVTQVASWDGTLYGFEIAIPVAWFVDVPAGQVAADGTGAPWLSGASFTTGGSFGAVATVRDVLDDTTGQARMIVADTVTGDVTFELTNATQLAFSLQPSTTPANSSMSTVTVEVQDTGGVRVPNSTFTVALAISADPSNGTATLGGITQVAAIDGIATFPDLTIDTMGDGYTLVATAPALTAATSMAFNITEPLVAAIDVATDPVLPDGSAAASARWGGWSADPGQSGVAAGNYLKIMNNGTLDEASFTVDFTPSSFAGTGDASWTVPIDAKVEFACAETLTGQAPQDLVFTFASASNSGSTTCTFSPGAAGMGVMYVQYRITDLPAVLSDQSYEAGFTVSLEA